jgi:erythromycin esterase
LAAQRPLNLDFERARVADTNLPWGWSLGWSAFTTGPSATFALDSLSPHAGSQSLRIAADTGGAPAQHTIMLQVASAFALGRTVDLTAWTMVGEEGGRAVVTLEAWGEGETVAADTATHGPTPPSSDWTQHRLSIRAPHTPDVHSLVVSVTLAGPGTAWFDDFSLFVNGSPVETLPPVAGLPSESDVGWLTTHATPLLHAQLDRTEVPNDTDLSRFRDIVGDAAIVGLGESTHGTREFFLVKHRLLEYLVRDVGFTVFAIEANQLAVERVNRYVQGGDGTARDAMRVMFRVWNTEGMRDLVEWMRGYNAIHPERRVRFAGYDMQDHRTPIDSLRAFAMRADPAIVPVLDRLTTEYRAAATMATPQIADSVRWRWSQQADTLWREVSARQAAWLSRATTGSDTVAAEWAQQAANLYRQAARFNVELSSPERDSLMAANLDWFLRTLAPAARAVVWAHDVHVSKGGDPERSFNGGAQMGAYLARMYGDSYRVFSLLTYEGAYTAARSFTDHTMIEAAAFPGVTGSLEAVLHELDGPAGSVGFLVDLRDAREDSGGAWLWHPRPIRHIGYAAYDYGFELNAVLPLEFDGVVFIDHTTASRLLP